MYMRTSFTVQKFKKRAGTAARIAAGVLWGAVLLKYYYDKENKYGNA